MTMEESPPMTPTDSSAGSPAESRAARRRARGRSLSSSTSSSSPFTSPSPSASPSPRSWSVPFSWEQRPGIPKAKPLPSPAADAYSITQPLLPLPPPARSHSRKKRFTARFAPSPDPFAAALALCAKRLPDVVDDDIEMEDVWGRLPSAAPRRVAAIADRFRLFGIYGSCKATCTVVDATVRLPRTRSFGSVDGRPGSSGPVSD
ncbi:hypothetical protein Cni_G20705 [Canna indica]|uniref:Uncharacterized protein n=1 Tax=Canna indica TaxID=4628 RepID=A0AAQ3QJZ4_9LILI|nr:hypothetical protein Cni_G20705 [Canna indica]